MTWISNIAQVPSTQTLMQLGRHSCGKCKAKEMKNTVHAANNEDFINCSRSGEILEERSLKELQQNDKDSSMVRKLMNNNKQPDTAEISSASSTVKALWSQRQKLVIENDMMYRKWDDETGVTLQAIVTLSKRRKIFSFCHDQSTSGHLGVRKTLSKVRQSHNCPGLQRYVRYYISGCEKWQMSKNPFKTLRVPMQMLGAGRPMEQIATDILEE
ncbi:MAG: integrase zinc binding domain-containing protein [Candidatus Thiodiazotropha sp.]